MTALSSFDPESFQELLSNAFVVQESGLDIELLSAIVKLQGSIARGDLDLDEALDLIAVRALNVASATGIAIGLLQADQLVYRAGCGSAATYVGHHVMATLCASVHNAASGEILRVENAQSDARIEAAICRQFGAQSMLILPIYRAGAVAGVLEVLFNEAHAFQTREVRSYRLMANLVEEAMSYTARPKQKTIRAADLSRMQQSIAELRPQIEEFLGDDGSLPGTDRAIDPAYGELFAEAVKVLALKPSAWAASMRAKYVPLYKGRWKSIAAVAAVVVIACWIAYQAQHPASRLGTSALRRSNTPAQQTPFVPVKRDLTNSTSNPPSALLPKEEGRRNARTIPQQVPYRNSQVRYIGEDVTVRYFTPQPAAQRVLEGDNQVHHISEDVTVRYFTPQPAVVPPPVGSAAQLADRQLPAPGKSR